MRAPSIHGEGRLLGRYVLHDEIASGGMASVYFGRMTGAVGFSRTVAIKRLHPHLAKDPDFVAMLIDEARLAARIVHPNVVPTLDVVADGDEVFIVMEYVQGEALSRLQYALRQRNERAPISTAITVITGVLHGLHAAHEAHNELGEPLGIVHRDVSPQNVLVGADGTVRLLDFGVAKAAGKLHSTREGSVKGKVSYMAPEQIRGGQVTRRSDIYAAAVLLWELLSGRRLFDAENDVVLVHRITAPEMQVDPPSMHNPEVSPELDQIVLRGLAADPERRFATAREMAQSLERACAIASASSIGDWVQRLADAALSKRASVVASMEASSNQTGSLPSLGVPASAPRLAASGSETPSAHFVPNTPAHPPTPLRRSRPLLAVLIAAALLVAGAATWVVSMRPALHRGAAIALGRRAPPAAERPADPAPQPASSATVAEPAPDPADGLPAGPSSRPSSSLPPGSPRREPARNTKPKPAAVSCDPPYDIDALGHKTYKRACLK